MTTENNANESVTRSTRPAERDYPVGHPAASDYKGEHYTPPPPPLGRDYPVGHPKAADSPQNIAESEARREETSQPGQPGVPLPEEPGDEVAEADSTEKPLKGLLGSGLNFPGTSVK